LDEARDDRNDLLHALPVAYGLHRRKTNELGYVRDLYDVEDLVDGSGCSRRQRSALSRWWCSGSWLVRACWRNGSRRARRRDERGERVESSAARRE